MKREVKMWELNKPTRTHWRKTSDLVGTPEKNGRVQEFVFRDTRTPCYNGRAQEQCSILYWEILTAQSKEINHQVHLSVWCSQHFKPVSLKLSLVIRGSWRPTRQLDKVLRGHSLRVAAAKTRKKEYRKRIRKQRHCPRTTVWLCGRCWRTEMQQQQQLATRRVWKLWRARRSCTLVSKNAATHFTAELRYTSVRTAVQTYICR